MALVKFLDSIVKRFEEFVYMVAFYILQVWSYRWLVVTALYLAVVSIGGLLVYLNMTNGGLTWN